MVDFEQFRDVDIDIHAGVNDDGMLDETECHKRAKVCCRTRSFTLCCEWSTGLLRDRTLSRAPRSTPSTLSHNNLWRSMHLQRLLR
jgi:hypothetical protein